MSYCKTYGKDKVMFVTKEDYAVPSTIELPLPDPPQGLITSDGEINWSCPCLGGMATGPCGVQFRDAFSCFHYSNAEPKGSDCYEAFRSMQECFTQYPTVYNKAGGNDDSDNGNGDTDLRSNDIEDVHTGGLAHSTTNSIPKSESTNVVEKTQTAVVENV